MTLNPRSSAVSALIGILAVHSIPAQTLQLPNLFPFPNGSGVVETLNTAGNGKIDFGGPFFQSLGSNGRSCFSCHRPEQGWAISAEGMQVLFALTNGNDPVFRGNDGANCDHGT